MKSPNIIKAITRGAAQAMRGLFPAKVRRAIKRVANRRARFRAKRDSRKNYPTLTAWDVT